MTDQCDSHGAGGWALGRSRQRVPDRFRRIQGPTQRPPQPPLHREELLSLPVPQPQSFLPWGNARQTTLEINGSIVTPNVDGLVTNYTGNFFAFQAYFESVNVNSNYRAPVPTILTRPYRVLTSVLTPSWGYVYHLFVAAAT